jgi:hypothetical protein
MKLVLSHLSCGAIFVYGAQKLTISPLGKQMAIAHFLGDGASFSNEGSDKSINETLIRLMSMTKSGKVWFRDGVPVKLNINDWTTDAKQRFSFLLEQGEISRVVQLLFQKLESAQEPWERMIPYRVFVAQEAADPFQMHDVGGIFRFALARWCGLPLSQTRPCSGRNRAMPFMFRSVYSLIPAL